MEKAHQTCQQENNSLGVHPIASCTMDIHPIASECPSSQSPESLLSDLASNTSITIELVGLIPFPFKQPQSEAAFQARLTSSRITTVIGLSALFGALDFITGLFGIVNDANGFWALPPIVWLSYGILNLCILVITLVFRSKSQLYHKKVFIWLLLCSFEIFIRCFAYGFITYHKTSDEDFSTDFAASAGFIAGLFIFGSFFLTAYVGLPLYFFLWPFLYGGMFCLSPTLSLSGGGFLVMYCVGTLAFSLVVAIDIVRQQRLSFTAEVQLRRSMISETAARQREHQMQIQVQKYKADLDTALQAAVYTRIGASAVNHEAKRAISNAMTWMCEIERICIPVFEAVLEQNADETLKLKRATTALKEIVAQVRDDSEEAFDGCKNCIMNIAIASGTYQCVKEPFKIRHYLIRRIGCRHLVKLHIADNVPEAVMIDRSLFISLIRNLMNNAETHGKIGGAISVVVEMSSTGGINIIITNLAGLNQSKCLRLQNENGKNFLMNMHKELVASTQHIGNANSTFLGMREISDSADLLGASVDVSFEEGTVVTLLDVRNIEAPRSLAKGLLKKVKAHEDSLILGETYEGVLEVPEIVSKAVTVHGVPSGVVCIFDQQMHWPAGSVLGTQLCKRLRDQGFTGLIIIRSANDSDINLNEYLEAGADAAVSKGFKAKDVANKIYQLYHSKQMGAVDGFDLISDLHSSAI